MRDRSTFARLASKGTRNRCGAVTVTFVAEDAGTPPRVAYSVSRKVGGAVTRNILRRRLRSIVRDLATDLRPGAYLLSAAPAAAAKTFGELQQMVAKALEPMRRDLTADGMARGRDHLR